MQKIPAILLCAFSISVATFLGACDEQQVSDLDARTSEANANAWPVDPGNSTPSGASGASSSSAFYHILVADRENGRMVGMDDMIGSGWTTYALPNGGKPYGFLYTYWLDAGIFIVDGVNSTIVRIDDLSGANMQTYGSLGAGADHLNAPTEITNDSQGRLLIVDTGNNRIVRIDDITGANWTEFGAFGNGVNQFNAPTGIATDDLDRIYVVDSGNNRLVRIDDMSGANWTTFGTLGNGTGQFSNPRSISLNYTWDSDWNPTLSTILISDMGNNRIVTMTDMNGSNWTALGSFGNGVNQFNAPAGVNILNDGNLYVADSGNNRIVSFSDMTGANWTELGSMGNGVNEFNTAIDIFDPIKPSSSDKHK